MIALRIHDVHKAFPGTQALAGCSLELRAGECHGLVGENGAGKSTLMKILAGAEQADSGAIELFGTPARFRSPRESRAAGISAIYQELELIPELSVAENVFLGREPRAAFVLVDRTRMREQAVRLLASLGRSLDPGARLAGLNLAEKQLVEIARALAAEARVFLMDEPTAALGDRDRHALFEVIRKLTAGGAAVVFISHRLEEVLEICDRVTVMRDGRDVLSALAGELSRDRLIEAMAGQPPAGASTTARAGMESDRDLDAGGPSVALGPAGSRARQVPVLEADGLSSAAGLKNISVSLRAGEIAVATGLAGSGRTRLLRALFAADRVTAGGLRLNGREIRPRGPAEAAAAGIGFLGEERRLDGLLPDLSVRANVALPSLAAFTRPPAPVSLRLVSRRKEAAAVAEQAAAVQVRAASLETPIRLLSGGNQQKALLARWLLAGSRALLLDEPTRGVDINGKNEIYRLLREQADAGLAILVTTSELPEALLIADRILVMRDGAIAGELSRAEATPEKLLRLAMR